MNIDEKEVFQEQWIYIHSEKVRVGRIQNFKNWSAKMVPGDATSLGMEYFCDKYDPLWHMPDEELKALAVEEIGRLGLAKKEAVVESHVVRQEKAYPVYDGNFKASLAVIKDYLKSLDNLQIVGRNGTHCYNNMDHSVVSGIRAAMKIKGEASDAWTLPDNEYLEMIDNGTTCNH